MAEYGDNVTITALAPHKADRIVGVIVYSCGCLIELDARVSDAQGYVDETMRPVLIVQREAP